MGRKKGSFNKNKKNPFDALEQEWKDRLNVMDEVTIRKEISKVALDQVALMQAKKEDEDLKAKQEAYKIASEVYREGTKTNKLKVEYAKSVLDSQGK